MPCPICKSISTTGISLGNGNVIHSSCYSTLVKTWADTEDSLIKARVAVIENERNLIKSQQISSLLKRLFSGGSTPEILKNKLNDLKFQLKQTEIRYEEINSRVIPLFDLMLDYPPDWNGRVSQVKRRDVRCNSCGGSQQLQVHHVTPLSKGGNNRLSNLTLLCERCHRKEHGDKLFTYKNESTEILAISKRVQAIQEAIIQGRDVEFLYKKPADSTYKKRKIKPTRLKEYEYGSADGATLCLEGYCYSRREDRVFALKRMRDFRSV